MPQDITRIKQLLANYCHRVDRGTPEEVAALFAEDGILRPRFDGPYEVRGRAAVRGWFAHYNQRLRDNTRHLKHMISSIAIDVAGNTATASCYLTVVSVSNADNRASLCFGTYTDRLIKVVDTWLFAERVIDTHFLVHSLDMIEKLPSLGYAGATL